MSDLKFYIALLEDRIMYDKSQLQLLMPSHIFERNVIGIMSLKAVSLTSQYKGCTVKLLNP